MLLKPDCHRLTQLQAVMGTHRMRLISFHMGLLRKHDLLDKHDFIFMHGLPDEHCAQTLHRCTKSKHCTDVQSLKQSYTAFSTLSFFDNLLLDIIHTLIISVTLSLN